MAETRDVIRVYEQMEKQHDHAFCVHGIRTGSFSGRTISLVMHSSRGISLEAASFRDGDVIVLAETAVATAEGSVVDLGVGGPR